LCGGKERRINVSLGKPEAKRLRGRLDIEGMIILR
jgi:hypothetical protein